MRRRRFIQFILLVAIFCLLLWLILPSGPDQIKLGRFNRDLKLHRGLDLTGGAHLVYSLDTKDYKGEPTDALQQVVEVMRLRVDALGVGEPVIQTTTLGDTPAVIVEMPGLNDTKEARETIGSTAQLSFQTLNNEVVLTGDDVERATVVFDQTTSQPQVKLELTDKGAEAFAQATNANVGSPILIMLDDTVISAPTVQQPILNGEAVITGIGEGMSRIEAVAEVKQLSNQINSGALPVPITLVEERTIGASLGQEAVQSSLFAGGIGLLAIVIFMIFSYGLAGIVSVFTLVFYLLIMIFLIQFIPITLTLAGIAGLILTLGVTVDANILIFARMREEVRAGQDIRLALRNGFSRAWESIRDANLSSVITAIALFWFGTGPIRGFAVILILGVAAGIICAVTFNRIILHFLTYTRLSERIIK